MPNETNDIICVMMQAYVVLVLLSIALFACGAIVPGATGIYISSVSPQYRTTATSISVVMFNVLGYFGAPFISGLVMNASGSYR